jgi:uncharacterized surface protein with fasciclin (FAS1) repeats
VERTSTVDLEELVRTQQDALLQLCHNSYLVVSMFRFVAFLTTLVCVAAFAPRSMVARTASMQMANIVDTAVGAGNFKTLVAAVQAAGLAGTLSGPGPFSVFAPTDAAFAKLPAGTVDALLKDIPKLTSILTYHVVGKEIKPNRNGFGYETLNGKEIAVKVVVKAKSLMDTYEEYFVIGGQTNPAQVEVMSIKCDNGLIHVINEVLLPYEGTNNDKVGPGSEDPTRYNIPKSAF